MPATILRLDRAPTENAVSRFGRANRWRLSANCWFRFSVSPAALGHEGLPLVFSFPGRVGAVVWPGMRGRSWYVRDRGLVMKPRIVRPNMRPSQHGYRHL